MRAYVWYTLSIETEATSEPTERVRARELGIDPERQRKRISEILTPAQIAEAERLVAEWEPNPEECEVYAEQADD